MIQFQSTKESGNIFWILGAASKELKKQRRITEYNAMRDRVYESGSYEEALAIIREYVELIDLDGQH
jgi:hypothetical protein